MGDWIQYDWQVHGQPAQFVVNMGYADQQSGYDTLVYCIANAKGARFSIGEQKGLARLEKKLLKLLADSHYMGYIHMDVLRQYYFYVRNVESAGDALEAYSIKERKYDFTYGSLHEPDWNTYRTLLLPDRAKYQTILNGEVIARLQKGGDASEKVRRLNLLMCFPSEQTRLLFYDAARKAGFAIGDTLFQPEIELPHVQIIHIISALHKHEIDGITTRAIRIAEGFDGDLLRWTCPIMTKKNPLA